MPPTGREGRRLTVEHLDYAALRGETVVQVAKMMAGAAISAPKSGGRMFLQRKHNLSGRLSR